MTPTATFLSALALMLLAPLARTQEQAPRAGAASPAGTWRGRIEVPGQALDVVIVLVDAAGELRGTISIPVQKAKDLPLSVSRKGQALELAIQGVPGEPTFHATLAGDELRGTFTQGGQEFDFALARRTPKSLLGDFAAVVEKARADLDVPGVAVAVVKDGQVVFAQGFGVRDLDSKEAVTSRSLFAIGSCTKAMTAFVLATLLAEGKADWSSPVRDVVPEFALQDAAASTACTLEDLACHRSGLPRHDLVWYLAPMPLDEILTRVRHLPLSKPPRTQFQYCNFGYAVLGAAVARLGGASWDTTLRARLLDPLRMTRTRTHPGAFTDGDEVATGHHDSDGAMHTIPRRAIGSMGPAGSVESCVDDMARWLLLQLGEGSVDGRKLCERQVLAAQTTPRMPFAAARADTPEIVPVGYGLGWFVEVYRGHRHVQHGGGIDGFIAHVGFFPDDGFGVVALANRDETALPPLIDRIAADRLLGTDTKDWVGIASKKQAAAKKAAADAKARDDAGRTTAPPAHPLADYVGQFADPGYGTVGVAIEGDALALQVAGLKVALRHVTRETFALQAKASLAEVDGLQVLFVTGFDGEVEALRAKLEPTVPPITFTRLPDAELSAPATLARYTGRFQGEDGTVATVTHDGRGLSVSLPGQPTYALKPLRKDVFAIGDLDGFRLRFELEGDTATTAIFDQPNGVFRFQRKTD